MSIHTIKAETLIPDYLPTPPSLVDHLQCLRVIWSDTCQVKMLI